MAAMAEARPETPLSSNDNIPSTDVSDNESGGEKDARKKLRETAISQQAIGNNLKHKRSREDFEDGDATDKTRHVRQRSEEKVAGSDVVIDNINGSMKPATPEKVTEIVDEEMKMSVASPKTKRTREQSKELLSEEAVVDVPTPTDDRKTKRLKDSPPREEEEKESSKPATFGSGFSNTATQSPFASASNTKPPVTTTLDSKTQVQTSDEKFKSSGFGSFAASKSAFGGAASGASPFGAAVTSSSPWAASAATSNTQPSVFAAKPASGFGNTSTQSAFGSLSKPTGGSAFGSGVSTSGFGSLGGTTSSVFGTGPAPRIEGLSGKTTAFGASADDDEDEETNASGDEADTEGVKSPLHDEELKKDKRFYEQHIDTGEEGETTMFTHRAKLYQFKEGKWVERGVGNLKLNVTDSVPPPPPPPAEGAKILDAPEESAASGEVSARLILRVDGTNKVVLNSPIRKDRRFGEAEPPKGKHIIFMGHVEGSTDTIDTLQIAIKADAAKQLWEHVEEVKGRMKG